MLGGVAAGGFVVVFVVVVSLAFSGWRRRTVGQVKVKVNRAGPAKV
jgi:hypothetical protein